MKALLNSASPIRRHPQTGTESQSRCRSTGNGISRFSSPGNLSNSGMITVTGFPLSLSQKSLKIANLAKVEKILLVK